MRRFIFVLSVGTDSFLWFESLKVPSFPCWQADAGWQRLRLRQGVLGYHQAEQHHRALFERGHKVPRSRLHPQGGELREERSVTLALVDSGLIIQERGNEVCSCQLKGV